MEICHEFFEEEVDFDFLTGNLRKKVNSAGGWWFLLYVRILSYIIATFGSRHGNQTNTHTHIIYPSCREDGVAWWYGREKLLLLLLLEKKEHASPGVDDLVDRWLCVVLRCRRSPSSKTSGATRYDRTVFILRSRKGVSKLSLSSLSQRHGLGGMAFARLVDAKSERGVSSMYVL